ncbi:prepilin-type N-terminal cleavage/methylation domain-containing protein [bacterium]|nr:prepilin-type N-terminal cleavage/methylation domain-containing protein [bacterium]
MINRSNAFTLAEVLITLGIIGIVAAMTIPTLMQKTQKHQTVVGLKKAYTTMSQAYERSKVENGDGPSWDWTLGITTFMKTYIIPYLSIAKDCGTQNTDDCGIRTKTWLNGKTMECSENGCSSVYSVLLSDGTSCIFDFHAGHFVNIVVDINGNKKPNIIGKDIFFMRLFNISDSGFYKNQDLDKIAMMDFYVNTRELALSDNRFGCNKLASASAAGLFCGKLIQLDGWEIKDDYPW